ncbi:MAG: aromatic ring-hydroxylating dioxygenase subunit alpha [Paracoccaceae bacterium]|nr:aromatic ring-hydroxylating dioxygenase subunit alpha [Paracoccaceae bacterium]
MDGIAAETEIARQVRAILGEDGLVQITRPIEEPGGLPNAAYWSADWLALEQARLFRRNWVFACAAAELTPGGVKPIEVGGTPVIAVRDTEGTIRAFHNHCRHRGTMLVQEECVAKTLTCPYHAWAYRLDGKLRSRPHFHGPGKVERFDDGAPGLDLAPVRCEVWNGCVFVDISGAAPALDDWLAPMLRRTSAFDFAQIRWIGKRAYRIKANWKLVLENYMEGYHVFAAHPRLVEHAPMHVRWSGEWLEHVFYNDYVAPGLSEGRGDGLPHYPGLSDEDARRGMWFAVMPNFLAEVYADQFVVMSIHPTAPDETEEELHFFVVGDEAAEAERYAKGREDLIAMWHDLNLEDVQLLERLQQGRRSIGFQGSVMSPAWEVPAHQLSAKIVEAILAP